MSADIVDYAFIQKDDTNAKIKAVYLYNFTRYFEWPNAMQEGNFVICTVGSNSGLNTELNKLAGQKMVGNQKIEIKTVNSVAEAGKSNIVYLLGDNSSLLKDAMSVYKGKGTLVITEKSGMAKAGAVINFIIQENKQKFELNTSSATKTGLKVSSNLKDLAAVVYE
jgi:Fe-S cluster assembly iron-binding protein IscA